MLQLGCNHSSLPGDLLGSGISSSALNGFPNVSVAHFRGWERLSPNKLGPKAPFLHVVHLKPDNRLAISWKNHLTVGKKDKFFRSQPFVMQEREIIGIDNDGYEPFTTNRSLEVVFEFNGRTKMLDINGKQFSLKDGKVFVVNYSDDWRVSGITQTDVKLNGIIMIDDLKQAVVKAIESSK